MKKTILLAFLMVAILIIAGCSQQAKTTDAVKTDTNKVVTGNDGGLGNELNGDIDSSNVNDLDDVEVNPDELL